MKDLVIVGGSGAGITAGIYAIRSGLSVTFITKNFGGQLLLTEKIENYPGFKSINGFDLAMQLKNHLKSYEKGFPLEIIEGSEVVKVKKIGEKFETITKDNKKFESLAVIIASGRHPRKLQAKNADRLEARGVHYCAICDGPFYKGEPIAVIGGGFAGIEEALYLSDIASEVSILEYSGRLKGEAITIEQLKKKNNVKIFFNARVTEVLGEKSVEGLKFEDLKEGKEKELKVKAIFVNIGEIPNSDIVECEKDEQKRIKINFKNETSIPGLFAAGDVTDFPVNQLITSAGEGCKAALYANEYIKKLKSK
jgi:thioredoxin-disulfide reductase